MCPVGTDRRWLWAAAGSSAGVAGGGPAEARCQVVGWAGGLNTFRQPEHTMEYDLLSSISISPCRVPIPSSVLCLQSYSYCVILLKSIT